jgi:hypothetical protein
LVSEVVLNWCIASPTFHPLCHWTLTLSPSLPTYLSIYRSPSLLEDISIETTSPSGIHLLSSKSISCSPTTSLTFHNISQLTIVSKLLGEGSYFGDARGGVRVWQQELQKEFSWGYVRVTIGIGVFFIGGLVVTLFG